MAGRWGLLRKDVERRPGQRSLLKGPEQVGHRHQAAAGSVDQVAALGHRLEQAAVYEPPGLLRERRVKRDQHALRKDLLQAGLFHPFWPGVLLEVRITAQRSAEPGTGAPCEGAADAPDSHHAEGQ